MTFAESMDQKAKALSNDLKRTEAALLNLLIEMKKKKSFAELGFTGVFSYCEGALKLSNAQSHYFQKVVEKVDEVPELKMAIDTGKLTISQARRIVPVLTSKNQNEWIEKAASLKQKELEQAVTIANPEARIPKEKIRAITPEYSELKITVTVEEEKEICRIQDLLSKKLRKPVGLKEAIIFLGKDFLRKQDPVLRAEKLAIENPSPQSHKGREGSLFEKQCFMKLTSETADSARLSERMGGDAKRHAGQSYITRFLYQEAD